MYLPKVIAFNAKDETAKKRYGEIADFMELGCLGFEPVQASRIAFAAISDNLSKNTSSGTNP